jgi:uncharacterized protein (TIGR03437 family)
LNRSRSIVRTVLIALLLCAGAAMAQTPGNVAVVSGNGQLICQFCFGPQSYSFQPMVVKVTDASGNPVNNASVNWTVTSGGFAGSLAGDTSFTDANGLAFMNFFPSFPPGGTAASAFFQTAIVATAGNSSATFYLTQGLQANAAITGGVQLPPIVVRVTQDSQNLFPGAILSGQVGSTSTPPIRIQVVTQQLNTPVPNVSLLMINDPTVKGGTVQCASQAGAGINAVLTDANGIATCNPVFGGTPGTAGSAQVSVGGAYPLEHFTVDPTLQPNSFVIFPGTGAIVVNVTPGAPGAVTLVSGNSQSAQAGSALASPLVVKVVSTAGTGLAGQTVNWTVTPTGGAVLGSSSTTTDANGQTSNTIQFPTTASGAVQVKATLSTDSTKSVTFTATAIPNISVTGLQIVSGNNQSAIVNTSFAAPLVVQLGVSNGSASGIPVQFSISGPGTLSSSSVNTGSAGQAQVLVQAGATAGAVTVVASASGFTQSFSLTVTPPGPTLTANSFFNAADFQRGSISPCSLATIIATGLAPGLQGMVSGALFGPLPYVLAGDKVSVGGSAAPIFSVGVNSIGQEQLTFQVPCDVAPGSSVPVIVTVGAGSNTVNVPIQAASPGIFQTVMSDNVSRAVLVRPDGSFVSVQNPARRGENLVAFLTGLGPATTPVPTNSVASPNAIVTPQGTVVAGMAGGGVPLVSSQLSDELVGLWMVTFTVPADVTTGSNVSFSISVIPAGGTNPISSGASSIPVQ